MKEATQPLIGCPETALGIRVGAVHDNRPKGQAGGGRIVIEPSPNIGHIVGDVPYDARAYGMTRISLAIFGYGGGRDDRQIPLAEGQ